MASLTPRQRTTFLALMLALFAAIAIAALLVALGYFPRASSSFKTAAVPTLLADIAAAVFVVWRTEFGADLFVVAAVTFEDTTPPRVKLDMTRCLYEIFDRRGQRCGTGIPAVSKGPSGWTCKIPLDARSDIARLVLVEENGTQWTVSNFGVTGVVPVVASKKQDPAPAGVN